MERANSHGIPSVVHALLMSSSHQPYVDYSNQHARLCCFKCIQVHAYTQENVNLSTAELKFQAEENHLSFKSQTGPDFALRCHFDGCAVNQS